MSHRINSSQYWSYTKVMWLRDHTMVAMLEETSWKSRSHAIKEKSFSVGVGPSYIGPDSAIRSVVLGPSFREEYLALTE